MLHQTDDLTEQLTNGIQAESVFKRYYNSEKYFDALGRWFNIQTGVTPGGYMIRLVPVRKNDNNIRLGDREMLNMDDYCFSVMTLYYSLIPQAIGNELDTASMYRYHRATGLPMLLCDQNTLLSPKQTLIEAGLFPSDKIIDLYSSFVYNTRKFIRREMMSFFSGAQANEMVDTDAYHILCSTMQGHLDDFWRLLERELDVIFFPANKEEEDRVYFLNQPLENEMKPQSRREAKEMAMTLLMASENQALMGPMMVTSRKRNPFKVTPKVQEVLDRWNEGMKHKYSVSAEYSVPLLMGLYAKLPDRDVDVLDLMRAHQPLNIDLEAILTADDIAKLRRSFAAVANHCFSREYHPSILPNKAFDALIHFLDARPGMSVLNPCFSTQSFVYQLSATGCQCEALEMGAVRWGMSKIYLDSRNGHYHGAEKPTMARYVESYEELGAKKKYDRIVAYVKDEDQENFDHTLKQWIDRCLNPDGIVAVLLPEEANVATDRWRALRKYLVEKGKLRGVVRLHDGQHNMTIWVAGHAQEESPYFMDLRDYASSEELKDQEQMAKAMADESQRCDTPAVKVRSANYSYHPLRYLPMTLGDDHETETTLGRLIELEECVHVEEGSGRWVGLSKKSNSRPAFSENPLDCTVVAERLREKEFTNAVELPVPSLLAIDHMGTMRVARLTGEMGEMQPLYAAARAFVFHMRYNTRCTEDFLLWLITHPNTNEQVKVVSVMQCREGSMQLRYCKSMLLPEDFKAIRVALPPVAEQLRILETDKRGHLTQLATEQEERYSALERDLSVKRHSIGQTLFRTSNWLQVLMTVRQRTEGVLKDEDLCVEGMKYTVKDVFDELNQAFLQLSQKVKSLHGNLNMECRVFDLKLQTDKFIDEHHYDVCRLERDWCNTVDTDILVHFPPEALSQILENILSNAVSHGFGNRSRREDNIVRFSLELIEGDYCRLTVANNGAKMSAKMDKMDLFEYGTTICPQPSPQKMTMTSEGEVHSGIGGYQIRQLMEQYGGSVAVESVADDPFHVRYHLDFKLVNKNR